MTPAARGRIERFLHVLWEPRSYLTALYMLTAFPLGLTYFFVLLGGGIVGAFFTFVLVGLLILLAALVAAWGFALFERELAIGLLGADIPPLALPNPELVSPWQTLGRHLRQPATWRSLAYLLVKLPFGIFATGLSLALLVPSVAGMVYMDGLSVCRELRRKHLMPIIMLTARSEVADRVSGLQVGADDYLGKPFSIVELSARISSLLRRVALDSAASSPDNTQPITFGTLVLDPSGHMATLAGSPLELSRREMDLLELLFRHPGRTFSRDYLLEQLWGADFDGLDRAVDTQMVRLRKSWATSAAASRQCGASATAFDPS